MTPSFSPGAPRATPPTGRIGPGDDFARQPTSAADLPDPEPILHNLTVGILEVLAGVREIEQLARWLTEDAYRRLLVRASLAARARSARGVSAGRPAHRVLRVRYSCPADGVVEGVVVVAGPARTRAVAIRLEGVDRRWRATSVALL